MCVCIMCVCMYMFLKKAIIIVEEELKGLNSCCSATFLPEKQLSSNLAEYKASAELSFKKNVARLIIL